jgi:hypothetical protein
MISLPVMFESWANKAFSPFLLVLAYLLKIFNTSKERYENKKYKRSNMLYQPLAFYC